MKWSERFATGVTTIDVQHQLLFRMAGDYAEALAAGKGQRAYDLLLIALTDYARAHFGFEEQCMHRHHCPAASANSTAHHEFLAKLDEFRAKFTKHGYARQDAEALVRFLERWLADHIGRLDTQLKHCIHPAD